MFQLRWKIFIFFYFSSQQWFTWIFKTLNIVHWLLLTKHFGFIFSPLRCVCMKSLFRIDFVAVSVIHSMDWMQWKPSHQMWALNDLLAFRLYNLFCETDIIFHIILFLCSFTLLLDDGFATMKFFEYESFDLELFEQFHQMCDV